MLNIATGNDGLYNDHTVTVYAYTGFTSNETSTYHYFYKVRDGFTNEASSTDNGRYVANDALGAAYITRVS
jgi:hypothetical protein